MYKFDFFECNQGKIRIPYRIYDYEYFTLKTLRKTCTFYRLL